MNDEVREAVRRFEADWKSFQGRHASETKELNRRIDELDLRIQGSRAPIFGGGDGSGGLKAFIARLDEHKADLERSGRLRFTTGTLLEQKSTITSAGLYVAQPATGIQGAGRFPYMLRRLFRVVPAPGGSVFVLRSTTESLSPAATAEASLKPESTATFTGVTIPIEVVASFVNVSRQALDDVAGMEPFLDAWLIWGLEREAEAQILSGDSISPNLSGLTTTAAAFDISILEASEGYYKIDILGAAACQLREAGYSPDFAVVSPRAWFRFLTTKTSTGEYVLGSPRTAIGQAVWDLTIVVSDRVSENQFLVGDSRQAVVRQRMETTIDVSFEHASHFTSNLACIRAEERFTIQKLREEGFVTGTLSSSPA